MSGTVSMSGLVSNTDWAALIEDIIDAQKAAAINPLENAKTRYQEKLTAWQAFNTMLSGITNTIETNELNGDDGYAIYAASLSSTDATIDPDDVLNVIVGDVDGPGNYGVEVSTLARAEKIASDAFTSKTADLSLTGDLVVNGEVVSIGATDSLMDIADRITSANAGVIATILTVSDTEHRLLLESKETGAAGMSLKNGSSANILESLKLHTSSVQLAHASGLDALSDSYSSSTTAIGTLLGLTTSESATIRIRGTDDVWTDVPINLGTSTLTSIRDYINNTALPTGVTASIQSTTEGSTTTYALKLTNVDVNDLTDASNILETVGLLKGVRTNTTATGLNASLTIDGFGITSSSNSITSAIPGVTLNLTGANVGKPVTVRVAYDSSKLSTTVSGLVTGVNSALSYIKDQNTYNSEEKKPLMGESSLTIVRSSVLDILYQTVSGNTTYKNMSSIGITFGKEKTLSFDTSVFATALSANREEVVNVLKSFSDSLFDKLDLYVDPYTGSFASIETAIKSSMERIDTRIEELEERFVREAEILEKRYNALELLISTSNMTKDWLSQQTKYMTGSSKS